MREEEISHSGVIVEITPERTVVEIVSESACASCHARGACGASGSGRRLVEVPTDLVAARQVGDEVQVNLKKTMGYKAVWVGYGIPLAVLLTTLFTLRGCGIEELYCGLSAIGAVLLYYGLVFLFRNRLRNEYTFYIK
ncbi:MAG: SoxR reducing system RseC family protein [Bacteroidales bacterium]|nr:SoxR reducing system RseC family protein [Bacteroidales bacterium]